MKGIRTFLNQDSDLDVFRSKDYQLSPDEWIKVDVRCHPRGHKFEYSLYSCEDRCGYKKGEFIKSIDKSMLKFFCKRDVVRPAPYGGKQLKLKFSKRCCKAVSVVESMVKIVGILVLLCMISSCVVKQKTVSSREEITRIDTVVKVVIDTSWKKKEGKNRFDKLCQDADSNFDVWITDTVKVENKVAEARAYFDVETSKVAIEIKGKVFDLPVEATKIVKKNSKVVKKKGMSGGLILIVLGVIFGGLTYLKLKK
jgi:hypothetical protein